MCNYLESDKTNRPFKFVKENNVFSATYNISNAQDVVTRTVLPSSESNILHSCVRVTLKDPIKPGTGNGVSNEDRNFQSTTEG